MYSVMQAKHVAPPNIGHDPLLRMVMIVIGALAFNYY